MTTVQSQSQPPPTILINDWIEKYSPKKRADIIGHGRAIASITDWLKKYDSERDAYLKEIELKSIKKTTKSRKKTIQEEVPDDEDENNIDIDNDDNDDDNIAEVVEAIIPINAKKTKLKHHSALTILGNHGAGKTSLIKVLLKDLGYEIDNITTSGLSSNKIIDDRVTKIMKGVNILDNMNNLQNTKRVIVIDELETITTQTEKKFIESILKYNDENWCYPIIFISSPKHSKLITTLKNNTVILYLDQPSNENLLQLFQRICATEGKNLKFDSIDTINLLVSHIQSDYRRLLHILCDLRNIYCGRRITKLNVEEYCNFSKIKDTDIEIRGCTSNLILQYKNMNECHRVYNSEKVIIPLMIHQNYPECLMNYNSANKVTPSLKVALDLAESISMGDIIENYIFSEQNWDMQEVHCFYTCSYPSYKLTNLNMNVTQFKLKMQMNFPYDLNRTSIKNINKRNVINAQKYLSNMNIDDLIYANTLTNKLIDNDEIDECADIYKSYGAKSDIITSVLKIDKINIDLDKPKQNIKKLFNKLM